jgi:hypothetical protein
MPDPHATPDRAAIVQAIQLLHEGYGSDCPHSSDAEFIAAVQTLVEAGLFDEEAT